MRVLFIPVLLTEEDFRREDPDKTKWIPGAFVQENANRTCKAVSAVTQKELERAVMVVSVMSGEAPVYFVNSNRETAWIRRDGGIAKMSTDLIVNRITQGRDPEAQFATRKDLLSKCIDFLQNDNTRLLVLYGSVSVGKSHLAEYIKQLALSDRNLFPEKPQVYQIDLKGTI